MEINNNITYFPIADDLPSEIKAIENIPCNVNKHIYELSLSLFTDCNLRCSFCFQNDERKQHILEFDKDYMLSIPNAVNSYVANMLDIYQSKILYIRIWGGELFQDKFGDADFDVYKQLCNMLTTAFAKSNPNVQVKFNFMTNGIWEKNFDRIIDLAKTFNAYIGFSYDPVGRYAARQQQTQAIESILKIYNTLGYTNVAITLTSPNIKKIADSSDLLFSNPCLPYIAIETNMYIPNHDWKINLPTGEQIYEFYKYCIDNKLFMINSVVQYVQTVLDKYSRRPNTICDCKASIQHSKGQLISDCVMKSTCLPLTKFYGKYASLLTTSNCHDIKAFCAISKRNCLICKYYDRCPGFCSASILFDEYKEKRCPILSLFEYIECNRTRVQKAFDEYRSKYKLSDEMLNDINTNG